MRTAIYARVSTTAHQSVEMQLRDLRDLGARRGFEIVAEYCDEGISGAKNSRPALDKMLADGCAGKFRTILVWKLDRLGRSLLHLVRLLEEFRRIGIELVSFSEGLDFTTTTGKLLFQIISAFARVFIFLGIAPADADAKAAAADHDSPDPVPMGVDRHDSSGRQALQFPEI